MEHVCPSQSTAVLHHLSQLCSLSASLRTRRSAYHLFHFRKTYDKDDYKTILTKATTFSKKKKQRTHEPKFKFVLCMNDLTTKRTALMFQMALSNPSNVAGGTMPDAIARVTSANLVFPECSVSSNPRSQSAYGSNTRANVMEIWNRTWIEKATKEHRMRAPPALRASAPERVRFPFGNMVWQILLKLHRVFDIHNTCSTYLHPKTAYASNKTKQRMHEKPSIPDVITAYLSKTMKYLIYKTYSKTDMIYHIGTKLYTNIWNEPYAKAASLSNT